MNEVIVAVTALALTVLARCKRLQPGVRACRNLLTTLYTRDNQVGIRNRIMQSFATG